MVAAVNSSCRRCLGDQVRAFRATRAERLRAEANTAHAREFARRYLQRQLLGPAVRSGAAGLAPADAAVVHAAATVPASWMNTYGKEGSAAPVRLPVRGREAAAAVAVPWDPVPQLQVDPAELECAA
jgi:hypothetical protein